MIESVTLAKALKIKNRLAGRLTEVSAQIKVKNSVYAEEAEKLRDVEKLLLDRAKLVDALVEVKTCLYIANKEIQETLYLLAEKKAEIVLYQGINTKDGIEYSYGAEQTIKYTAFIKDMEAKDRIKELESEIDTMQDEIDTYNATHRVLLSQATHNLL